MHDDRSMDAVRCIDAVLSALNRGGAEAIQRCNELACAVNMASRTIAIGASSQLADGMARALYEAYMLGRQAAREEVTDNDAQ